MDQNEKERLRKQYSRYADLQIESMLADSPEAFVEGAYELLLEEAGRRGIKLQEDPGMSEDGRICAGKDQGRVADASDPVEAFVQIMIVNSLSDKAAVESVLDSNKMRYYLQNISVGGKDLPLALMVAQGSVAQSIEYLESLDLSRSISLW